MDSPAAECIRRALPRIQELRAKVRWGRRSRKFMLEMVGALCSEGYLQREVMPSSDTEHGVPEIVIVLSHKGRSALKWGHRIEMPTPERLNPWLSGGSSTRLAKGRKSLIR